jgi:SAM-dependent methyltransferase
MFPPLYSAHHSRYQEDLPFWQHLAEGQGGPILELGCGTGRVLAWLARLGYQMVGLDHDLEMLRFLCSELDPSIQPAPLLFAADIGAFRLGLHFPLILLPCNTWSILPLATRGAALECVREHLLPDGLFAVSVPSPDLLSSLPTSSAAEIEESYEHPLTGDPVQVSSGWRRTKQHFVVTWHYDHLLPDGTVQRLTRQARHSLASAQDYQAEIRLAGLDIQAVYGDFDRSPYTPTSSNLILVAQKPII